MQDTGMVLYLIGIGLSDEQDITIKGLEAIKNAEKVYLEYYTSRLQVEPSKLEALYGKKLIVCNRELVEQRAEDTILADAQHHDVAFLVIGDVMSATTHSDLILRAKEKKIPVVVINNTSIMNAVGNTGLELYKFGKTTSIVFPQKNYAPETCYDIIKQNQSIGAHTLCLLDIHADAGPEQQAKCMTLNEGLQILLDIEKKRKENVLSENTLVLGCARMGAGAHQLIKAGTLRDLLTVNFGKTPHCIVIPAKTLHFKEEEMVGLWRSSKIPQ